MKLAVHARLPAAFRRASPNAWARERRGGDVDSFLEGPCCDSAGNLWCVDIANGRILRLDAAGDWSVALSYDGWPTGLKLDRRGIVYVADNRLGVLRFDPKSGDVRVLVDRYRGDRLHGPNDLCLSSNGDLYFTDQGQSDLARPFGRVLRLARTGAVDLIADGIPGPNGIVLTGDERLLYVAATQANAIWRVALRPDGAPGKLGHFVQLSGSLGGGPDGLAIDSDDNLLVCHALARCLRTFDRFGEPVGRIETAEGMIPTNLAFDFAEPQRLYVCEAETGTIQTVRLGRPGRLTHAATEGP